MQRVFHIFVEAISWLAIFMSPALIGTAIGLFIYLGDEQMLLLFIVFASAGGISGIIFAERIRRKYGCSRFMSMILGGGNINQDN